MRGHAIETDVTVTNGNTIIFIAFPFRGRPSCRIARWARFQSCICEKKKKGKVLKDGKDGIIGAAEYQQQH